MTDFDYDTEKSDILLFNLNITRKDDDVILDMFLEPCRFIATGLHFIVSMKLAADNKLFCLGFGTS